MPEKEACQLFAAREKAKADILIAKEKIFKTVAKAVDLKADIKYGIGVIETVFADYATSIYAVASSVAQNTMGSISTMVTDVFELIYGALLKILLIAPSNVFGLISIPQEAAMEVTSKERVYINKAYINLQSILNFFNKWKGKSGVDYYNQMNDAMPYLRAAIELADKLISDLEVDLDDPNANARFNENFFKSLRANINQAIKITTPTSTISRESDIVARKEELKNKKYKEKSTVILNEYRAELNRLNSDYREDTQKLINDDSFKSVVKLDLIRAGYGQKLKALDLWKKERLSAAEIKSEAEAIFDSQLWVDAGRSLRDSFFADCTELYKNLEKFYKNIGYAFVAYKSSRIYCNNMYDMKDIIINLIKEMIALMRVSSNEVSQTIIPKLEKAQSFVEFTEKEFKESIEEYLDSSQQTRSTVMAATVMTGNGALIAADVILNTTVTQSMIDLLNLDDLLDDKSGEFNEFVDRLKNIRDWNGNTGVWAVNLATGAPSPYIQLLADASTMLMKVATLSARNNEDDIANIEKVSKEAFRNFRIINKHNSEVSNVLSSYTPYSGTDILDLKRILDNSGLTDRFAKGMSVITVLDDLASFIVGFFDDDNVNYKNCKAEYPDDFDEHKLVISTQNNAYNLKDPKVTSNRHHIYIQDIARKVAEMNGAMSTTESSREEKDDTRN